MMSDADVDGSHIRTLLMTFFYRQMPRLVAEGHLYVAQPPLYMITQKKERTYVRVESEMQAILIGKGLEDASLETVDPKMTVSETDMAVKTVGASIAGDRLKTLVEIGTQLESALRVRQAEPAVAAVLVRAHSETGLLPLYHIPGKSEAWLYTAEELEAYNQRRAIDAPPASDAGGEPETDIAPPPLRVDELHEVRVLNKGLARLRDEYGLARDAFAPRNHRRGTSSSIFAASRRRRPSALGPARVWRRPCADWAKRG